MSVASTEFQLNKLEINQYYKLSNPEIYLVFSEIPCGKSQCSGVEGDRV